MVTWAYLPQWQGRRKRTARRSSQWGRERMKEVAVTTVMTAPVTVEVAVEGGEDEKRGSEGGWRAQAARQETAVTRRWWRWWHLATCSGGGSAWSSRDDALLPALLREQPLLVDAAELGL
jgi:hypothetical protein